MAALRVLCLAMVGFCLVLNLNQPYAFGQSATGDLPTATMALTTDEELNFSIGTTFSSSGFSTPIPQATSNLRRYRLPEVEGYDGWYNNLAHPDWGRVDAVLTRILPPVYSDGVYLPSGDDRPNPFVVSQSTMEGPKNLLSYQNRTALLTFFGQQVVEEILDAQRAGCPPEYHNIPIPKCHSQFDPECKGGKKMPFLRGSYNKGTGVSPGVVRDQKNEITPWIDGGLFYGTTKAWADALRSFKDGLLKCSDSSCLYPERNKIGLPFANPPPPTDHYHKNASRFFMIGNPRGNENPMLLTMGIVFFRLHNWHARRLKREFDKAEISYDDEILFQRARQWVIAEHQNIVLNQWLPSLLPTPPAPYTGYKPSVHPAVSHIFQSAAMRFGHTLVPPFVHRAIIKDGMCKFRPIGDNVPDGKGSIQAVRTCNSFWNSPDMIVEGHGIEELLLGMAHQITEREDNIVTEDLRGFVFGPLEFSRRDLMAVNIQRGRDHGLPDYNTARQAFGLPRVNSFEEINNSDDPNIRRAIRELARVYNNNTNIIDIWPGGLLETTREGPGPLFTAVIKDQFERIRDADRFWFENEQNGLFNATERQQILDTTFRDVLVRVANASWWRDDFLQQNVFRFDASKDTPSCQPPQYTPEYVQRNLNKCTPMKTFDYFDGSPGPYIGTFVAMGLFLVLCVATLYGMVRYQKFQRLTRSGRRSGQTNRTRASYSEWVKLNVIQYGDGDNRPVTAYELKASSKKRHVAVGITCAAPREVSGFRHRELCVYDSVTATEFRKIDLTHLKEDEEVIIYTSMNKAQSPLMLIRIPHHSDILLEFSDGGITYFSRELQRQLAKAGLRTKTHEEMRNAILEMSFTEKDHEELVSEFFRIAFQEATPQRSKSKGSQLRKLFSLQPKDSAKKRKLRMVYESELTKHDFAMHLGMKPSSLFVQQLFKIVDADSSGRVTFEEFFQFITLLIHGSEEQKATMLFDLYDLDRNGTVDLDELYKMLMLSAQGERLEGEELKRSVNTLLKNAGLEGKEEFSADDFVHLFTLHRKDLAPSQKAMPSARTLAVLSESSPSSDGMRKRRVSMDSMTPSMVEAYRSREDEIRPPTVQGDQSAEDVTTRQPDPTLKNKIEAFWDVNRRQIFWATLYTLVLLLIFVERAYYYSVEREHVGLRRIAGYGVTVTRGAASAMMFTYSSLLVTMCRNFITFLRETWLNRFVPFDSAVNAHKFIAGWALLFTVVHCIGHSINFYHVATQPADDLTCLFRNYFHLSHELPKFQFWMWNTVTGVTGFLLVLVVIAMYVFALQFSRRHLFKTFWLTHHLYVVLYALIILHGSGRLVQPPIFQWFFIGPAALFAIDKLISVSRKSIELQVLMCERLPSDVTHIRVHKPTTFDYMSGQWARIAVLALNGKEFHPFTITSAPHEPYVDFYIRAVGPFTQAVRTLYDPDSPLLERDNEGRLKYPTLFMDGPYGEGHQDWFRYPVAVLVGGGIGVTPFASIMKDLVHKQSIQARFATEKVYFLWVTRTQKQFEWMTDIIREVEEEDSMDLLEVHVFITQFYQKFDLRTCMLYICEKHFHKVSRRSLFTGLRSETHFGRPDFKELFTNIKQTHSDVGNIGVFSCGPPPMTRSVEKAVSECNLLAAASHGSQPVIVSHSENF